MGWDIILFDLDGTLTDPGVGITKSVQYSLRSFGIAADDLNELRCYIGPPLRDSFRQFHGFSTESAEEAVAKYREYFAETGIFENKVYPGIPALLQGLRGAGKTLALATSKPHAYAKRILAHFGLEAYFSFVSGSEMDGTRSLKEEVIRYALDHLPGAEPSRCVMVGDRLHDIRGAIAAGVDSVGVLYGYGSEEELREAGAGYIARDVAELGQLTINN